MEITLIQAIAKMEGFGANPNNIPTRCNNPGDICAGQFANAHGAMPAASDPMTRNPSRYAVFPTAELGWAALRALLAAHYLGMTIAAAIAKYAPATENNTNEYVLFVCRETGLTPFTVLTAENIG
ncbi:MAG TPA: hypothetical protein VHW46_09855 [Terracidiphilus sp.]|jgi:hypothetical protein|nr:hypothetical protein [Terracidiphilus sp.]